MCSQKAIKRVVKPKVPVEPQKPSKFVTKEVPIGSIYVGVTSIPEIMRMMAEELGVGPKDVDWKAIKLIIDFDVQLLRTDKEPNPNYQSEMKSYRAKLKKYNNEVATFDRRMKLHEATKPVWLAWSYAKQQEKLQDEITKLQNNIRKIEAKKTQLLKNAKNEVPEDNS